MRVGRIVRCVRGRQGNNGSSKDERCRGEFNPNKPIVVGSHAGRDATIQQARHLNDAHIGGITERHPRPVSREAGRRIADDRDPILVGPVRQRPRRHDQTELIGVGDAMHTDNAIAEPGVGNGRRKRSWSGTRVGGDRDRPHGRRGHAIIHGDGRAWIGDRRPGRPSAQQQHETE